LAVALRAEQSIRKGKAFAFAIQKQSSLVFPENKKQQQASKP